MSDDAPRCASCGNKLRAQRESTWVRCHARAEKLVAQHAGAKIRNIHAHQWEVSWPNGTYGYMGHNIFCTLSCGYRFGLAAAKAAFSRYQGQP